MEVLRRNAGACGHCPITAGRTTEPTLPVTPNQGGVPLLCRLWGVILEHSPLFPSCQFLDSGGNSEEGQEEPHFLEARYVPRGSGAALCTH